MQVRPANTHPPDRLQAAKAVAGLKSPAAEVQPWQAAPLRMLGLLGEGANTEVSIRRAAPRPTSSSSSGSEGPAAAAAGCPVDPRLLAAVRVLCAKSQGEIAGRGPQQSLAAWDKPLQPLSSEVCGQAGALMQLCGMGRVLWALALPPLRQCIARCSGWLRACLKAGPHSARLELDSSSSCMKCHSWA